MTHTQRERYKIWYYKNLEYTRRKKREYDEKWRKQNPDKQKAKGKRWIQKHPEQYKAKYIWKARQRIRFLGKQIQTNFRQLTGYCSQCSNNIFDGQHKRTEMHHLKYIPCMPWACRIELCIPCHRKTRIGEKRKPYHYRSE